MRTDLSSALHRPHRIQPPLPPQASDRARDVARRHCCCQQDAAVVHCGTPNPAPHKIDHIYTRPQPLPIDPTNISPIDPIIEPSPPSVFETGKDFGGVYRNGHFKTEDGVHGQYFALNGGHIGFKIDGFHGILTGNDAVAFNPKTGESYTMKVRYGGGKFEVTDVKEYKPEPFEPGDRKPIFVEGENPHVRVKYNDEGEIKVSIKHPESDRVLEGKGFLHPDGTFMIAFNNGDNITGHYAFSDDGKLMIFDRRKYAEVDDRRPLRADLSDFMERIE